MEHTPERSKAPTIATVHGEKTPKTFRGALKPAVSIHHHSSTPADTTKTNNNKHLSRLPAPWGTSKTRFTPNAQRRPLLHKARFSNHGARVAI